MYLTYVYWLPTVLDKRDAEANKAWTTIDIMKYMVMCVHIYVLILNK